MYFNVRRKIDMTLVQTNVRDTMLTNFFGEENRPTQKLNYLYMAICQC